jgi:hypothetical protein
MDAPLLRHAPATRSLETSEARQRQANRGHQMIPSQTPDARTVRPKYLNYFISNEMPRVL